MTFERKIIHKAYSFWRFAQLNQASAWWSLSSVIPILNQTPKIVLEQVNFAPLNLVSNKVFFCTGPCYAGNPLNVLKNRGKAQRLPRYPLHPHSLPINIPRQKGHWLVTTSEPVSTHRYHAESTVYIRVHASCTFYRFGQTYDRYPSLRHQSVSTALIWTATNIY